MTYKDFRSMVDPQVTENTREIRMNPSDARDLMVEMVWRRVRHVPKFDPHHQLEYCGVPILQDTEIGLGTVEVDGH